MMSSENWLSQLPPAVWEAMRSCMTTVDVPAGTPLRRSGDQANGMCQVERGYFRLRGLHADGRQALILLYGPGNCFGEAPLIGRRAFRHTAVALTDARVRFLADRDFWELYHAYREIPDALCRKFAVNMRRHLTLRELRSTLRLRQLVAYCFTTLAAHCGVRCLDGATLIDLPLVQSDFAEFLDVTRQAVQREIGLLKRAGIISQRRSQWLIRGVERLGSAPPWALEA